MFENRISYPDKQLEQDLLKEYQDSHNLDVLGKLYLPYMTLVYGVCLLYLKDEEKSKDAVMQIFEEIIVKLKQHNVLNFKSWLYVVAKNYCLGILRKSSHKKLVSIEDVNMEFGDIMHLDYYDELKELQLTKLESCIEKLQKEQSLSIKLFYYKKMCYQDIAKETNLNFKKVKSYIQNGKRNLKICLEKSHE